MRHAGAVRRVAATFPAAKVVALGYYPIISDKTPFDARVSALLHLGPPDLAHELATRLDHPGATREEAARPFKAALDSMPALSALFAKLANGMITDAVRSLKGRAVFAVPRWRPEYSLGVSKKSWLWLGVNDSIFGERLGRYLAHLLATGKPWPIQTIVASMGHPNVAGSTGYADAIIAALGGGPAKRSARAATRPRRRK